MEKFVFDLEISLKGQWFDYCPLSMECIDLISEARNNAITNFTASVSNTMGMLGLEVQKYRTEKVIKYIRNSYENPGSYWAFPM